MVAGRTTEDMELLGQALDHIVTLEMRRYGQHRGVVDKLYAAAREKAGAPLSFVSAQLIRQAIGPGDTVLLTLGAHDPVHMPYGETDGPPGVIALALALIRSLAAQPVVVCEPFQLPAVEAAAKAGSVAFDASGTPVSGKLGCVELPPDSDAAAAELNRLLDSWDVKGMIAVERMGPNANGVTYTSTGKVSNGQYAPIHLLFSRLRERGVVSVGIGDNGNEVGMGNITDAVARYKPNGALIADATHVDGLVIANVSNWGAYAMAAMLNVLADSDPVLHTPAEERAMILACTKAGAVDGATGRLEPGVDGTSLTTQECIVQLIREVAANHFKVRQRAY